MTIQRRSIPQDSENPIGPDSTLPKPSVRRVTPTFLAASLPLQNSKTYLSRMSLCGTFTPRSSRAASAPRLLSHQGGDLSTCLLSVIRLSLIIFDDRSTLYHIGCHHWRWQRWLEFRFRAKAFRSECRRARVFMRKNYYEFQNFS